MGEVPPSQAAVTLAFKRVTLGKVCKSRALWPGRKVLCWVALAKCGEHSRGPQCGASPGGGARPKLTGSPLSLPAAVLKAEQAAVFKFPLAPLGCSGLGSALLAAGPGLPGAPGAPHLPLELQLRGKLETQGTGEPGAKAKKGRRSRTVFTELQLMGLEKRFEKQKYLSTPDR